MATRGGQQGRLPDHGRFSGEFAPLFVHFARNSLDRDDGVAGAGGHRMARPTRSPPSAAVLALVAGAGAVAAGLTVVLAMTRADLTRPVLRTAMIEWVSLPFIAGGLIAWRRRPESGFGRLMILAGFASMLSTLQWSDLPGINTVGRLCDLLVVAVWLQVFLAYPSGRLPGRPERLLVSAGYVVAVGLQVVVLMLGDFGTRHP